MCKPQEGSYDKFVWTRYLVRASVSVKIRNARNTNMLILETLNVLLSPDVSKQFIFKTLLTVVF